MLKFVLVEKVNNFLKEVKLELSKVTWPKKDQVIKLTLIVFIISGIVAIYVGGIDLIFIKVVADVLVMSILKSSTVGPCASILCFVILVAAAYAIESIATLDFALL